MTEKVRIEGQTATIGRATSRRKRAFSLAVMLGLMISGVWVLAYSPLAMFAWLMLAVVTIALALSPDREFVFDTGAKLATITRQYPWQSRGKVSQVAFSDICSIGVDRVKNDEGPDTYNAVLRLENRTFTLWTIEEAGRNSVQLFYNLDLVALHELTGLPYVNRD